MGNQPAEKPKTEQKDSWLASRMPLRQEYMAMRCLELFEEWVDAGMPRKDS